MDSQTKGLEQYAAKPVLVLSGSLLILSIALNNIGFRLDKVMEAWSISIVEATKAKYALSCPVVEPMDIHTSIEFAGLKERLERVEALAHEEGRR